MLTMAFYDDLHAAHGCGLNYHIRETRLYRGVEMNFRLLQYHRRAGINPGQEHEYRENLGDSEPHVREGNGSRPHGLLHDHSVEIGVFREALRREALDQPQLL